MGKSSSFRQNQSKILNDVEHELSKLNIEMEQNAIELVLAHFNFDTKMTVNAFINGNANDILLGWQTRKQAFSCSKTSTPKRVSTISSSNSLNLNQITTSVDRNKEEKNVYDDIKEDIANYEKYIKEYETKMEICSNEALQKYYIKSCSDLREQIRLSLIYREKLLMESKLTQEMKYLSLKVDYMAKCNKDRLRHELDCWDTGSMRSKEEQQDFKSKLIIYYQCGAPNLKRIKCMILNKYFDRHLVRASHIWKVATKGVGLSEFHLQESDVNNERNGLLLYVSIEKAFDCKKLCFLYNPFAGTLHVKILCDDLRETFIVDDKTRMETNESRTFNDIDNSILNLPPNVFPYRRLLNWHGRCAFKTAKSNEWINQDEHLEDFFYLSDLISLPGDDVDP